MSTVMPSFSLRVQKSAEVLLIDQETLLKVLSEAGITEAQSILLDSPTTTVEDLYGVLDSGLNLSPVQKIKKLQLKAAAGILKGDISIPVLGSKEVKLFSDTAPISVSESDYTITTGGNSIYYHMNGQGRIEQSIQQMPDHDLLVRYAGDRDFATSWELQRRSRNQPFIVLKSPVGKVGDYDTTEPGHEEIDIKMSLELLKTCRKKATHDNITSARTGYMIPVYRISELDMVNRVIYLCPICKDLVVLNRGYCPECHRYEMTNVKRLVRKCPAYMLRPAQSFQISD